MNFFQTALGMTQRCLNGNFPLLPVIPDAFKEVQRLSEAIGCGVFSQNHVITAARRHKNNGCHVIEALDPLSSFIPLASYIKHAAK